MKGLVFTEFLSMVETGFGLETTDTVIEAANPNPKAATRLLEPTTALS